MLRGRSITQAGVSTAQGRRFLLPSTEGVPNAEAAVRVLGHLGRARGPAGEVYGRWLPAARLHTAVLCGGASVRQGPQDVADGSSPAQLWHPFAPTMSSWSRR